MHPSEFQTNSQQNITEQMPETIRPQLDIAKQSSLSKSQSNNNLNFGQKLAEAASANAKLKELLQTIKSNAVHKKIETQQQSEKSNELQIARSKKKQAKLISEIEQSTNNLNMLINQNYKLKLQVDSSRNSRVIYSNVYKTLEKEIRKHQYLYKNAVIEGMAFVEIEGRVKEKVEKAVKKIEKEISEIQGIVVRKKQKQKSRLDTGLSTLRGIKLGSKETNRQTSKGDSTSRAIQTKRDQIICQSNAFIKKQGNAKSSRKMSGRGQKQQQISKEANKTDKFMRTRNKIPQDEEINTYFNLEMKSNYYDNVAMQLTKICGESSLHQIKQCWKNLESDIDAEFKEYLEAEERLKSIQKQMEEWKSVDQPTKQKIGGRSDEEKELQEVDLLIESEQQKVKELQQALSGKIDFNCSKLANQEIRRHILRIQNQGEISSRQLQKLLESVCKETNAGLVGSRLSEAHK